jgi:hypothetical protein
MSLQKLKSMLLSGNGRFNVNLVANYIGADQELFNQLMELIHHGKQPVPQRASWVMTAVTDKYKWMIMPHLLDIAERLPRYSSVHPALARNTLRQLAQIDLPEELMGKIFDCCYNFLNDTKQPIAIRVFSMQVLYNISVKEPGLQGELKLIIESQLEDASTGFANRAGKLLKKMKKQTI